MKNVHLTAQGVIVGVEMTIKRIIEELSILDKKDPTNLLDDDLTLLYFTRSLIDLRLCFCNDNIISIINVFKQNEKELNEHERQAYQFCLIINQSLRQAMVDNSDKCKIIGDKLNGKGAMVH